MRTSRRWRHVAVAVLAATSALLILPAPVLAQNVDERISDEAITSFLATYYKRPDPLRLPAILKAAQDNGSMKDKARRHLVVGFLAGLIAEDAKYVMTLAPNFADLPADQPMRLARAIAYSGRTDAGKQTALLKSLWPMKAAEIEKVARENAKPATKLPIDTQSLALDLNWGYFGATGRKEPVAAIIAALAGADDKANATRVANAYQAKLSLAINAMKNDRVLAWCREAQAGPHAAHIKDVLAAVQARDPDSIRRDGDAALKAVTRLIEAMAIEKSKPLSPPSAASNAVRAL